MGLDQFGRLRARKRFDADRTGERDQREIEVVLLDQGRSPQRGFGLDIGKTPQDFPNRDLQNPALRGPDSP